jgi:hypothetical protein
MRFDPGEGGSVQVGLRDRLEEGGFPRKGETDDADLHEHLVMW